MSVVTNRYRGTTDHIRVLAWIPIQQRRPNSFHGFRRLFRCNQGTAAGFLVYLYTKFHKEVCHVPAHLGELSN